MKPASMSSIGAYRGQPVGSLVAKPVVVPYEMTWNIALRTIVARSA
jgi:hypothetical protein